MHFVELREMTRTNRWLMNARTADKSAIAILMTREVCRSPTTVHTSTENANWTKTWKMNSMTMKPEDRLILCGRGLSDELDAILREEWEERAAIKEFLGNMPRQQAELEATQEMLKRAPSKK